MGRYLAAGVAVEILFIEKKNSFYSNEEDLIKKHKNKLTNQVSKFIDLNHYNAEIGKNYLKFTIDTEYFNNNIHECSNEFNSEINLDDDGFIFHYELKEKQEENKKVKLQFNQNDFPIELSYDGEELKLILDNNPRYDDGLDEQAFASNVWMFHEDTNDLFYKFKLYIKYACLYRDSEKILIEDDRNLLTTLNLFCKKTFKKGLSKNISFYISG